MRRPVIAPLVLALVLAACGGDAGETTTTTAAETTTTTAVETTTTTEATTTTTAAETTTTTTVAASGGSECLVGDWELDSEAFFEQVNELFGEEGFELRSGGGSYVVTLAGDGAYTGVRDEWAIEAGTADGTVRTILDGSDEGTWTADEETLTIDQTSIDISLRGVLIGPDGGEIDLPTPPVDITEDVEVFAGSVPYECTDDTLTITSAEGVTSTFDRR